ncbi:MAG: hypothetical protein JRN16_08420 [Nitrososphaerota archaeon]|nr:hypothetical protein [Nitrososphaerota archaeon]MDG6975204.1 hypothetical protein [Nitrososphaerota archaeon]MDG7010062.1 hypothetical protein [Nitrososphaerota archaeon]MDG7019500.1 hypothetical protein [Nitrososphaerota archaeon]MDG7028416.1 hypothetical protein [Nitrososphaerota archaeon]
MMFADVAVAILIGASAITGILLLNPAAGDATALRLRVKTALRDKLVSFVESEGVEWFLETPPATICSRLASASNATYTLSATMGSFSCGGPPPGTTSVSLDLDLIPLDVTLLAWSGAQA